MTRGRNIKRELAANIIRDFNELREIIEAAGALIKAYDDVPMYGMLEDEIERLRRALP